MNLLLFSLIHLAEYLLILLIISNNHLLVSLIFFFVFLFSSSFLCCKLYYFLPSDSFGFFFLILDWKEIQPFHPKGDQSWVFIGRTDVEAETPILATWCKELTHLKRSWCWDRLRAGGEGDNRGWDGWMASPTQWTWVWIGFRSWWWTGTPGMLQFMRLQRVGHDWATELNWVP